MVKECACLPLAIRWNADQTALPVVKRIGVAEASDV